MQFLQQVPPQLPPPPPTGQQQLPGLPGLPVQQAHLPGQQQQQQSEQEQAVHPADFDDTGDDAPFFQRRKVRMQGLACMVA
jgi:hypothetical protein